MEYLHLDDEIIADDWLIPREEISMRRLLKRTPRFNIYKADWFGDVLVYEPTKQSLARRRSQIASSVQDRSKSSSALNRQDLNSKLESFLASKMNQKLQCNCSKPILPKLPTDSAYSSLTTTPEHFTKHLKYEFPCNQAMTHEMKFDLAQTEDNDAHPASPKCQRTVLNEDSYKCSRSGQEVGDEASSSSSETDWKKLNELRLIAHESFILFMGALIEDSAIADKTTNCCSLVMQMNHPKAISLYNLLHANNLALKFNQNDRFFNFNAPTKQLNLADKLNICQQVTNAMAYLHDKDIVHGKLSSVNIYLETKTNRVKISLIDNSETSLADEQSGKLNLPALTYLSPELVRTIEVSEQECDNKTDSKQRQVSLDTSRLTKEADVFSFGTLLFEIFEERFPFSHNKQDAFLMTKSTPLLTTSPFDLELPSNWQGNIKYSASELIYSIGSGQIGLLNLSELDNSISSNTRVVQLLIDACWSPTAADRPQFKQLCFIQ